MEGGLLCVLPRGIIEWSRILPDPVMGRMGVVFRHRKIGQESNLDLLYREGTKIIFIISACPIVSPIITTTTRTASLSRPKLLAFAFPQKRCMPYSLHTHCSISNLSESNYSLILRSILCRKSPLLIEHFHFFLAFRAHSPTDMVPERRIKLRIITLPPPNQPSLGQKSQNPTAKKDIKKTKAGQKHHIP